MGKSVKLSKNATKSTLSAMKKTKIPKTVLVKNVVECWPVLNDEKVLKFIEILEQFLSEKNKIKQYITIGLESTIRSLNSNPTKITLLAIANEISPKWFGIHLISMALAKNPDIKIIILSNMKNRTKKLFDVPSIVWSMKNSELFDNFYEELNIHSELLKNYHSITKNTDMSIKKKKKIVSQEDLPEIIHLDKDPLTSTPVFVANVEQKSRKEFDSNTGFISLAEFDDPNLFNKCSPTTLYRPLKVKKIVGNLLRKGK